MKEKKFDIGDHLKDKISGYEGIVTAITEWYNGCIRYRLEPSKLNKDTGGLIESETFDEEQLENVEKQKVKVPKSKRGGLKPNDMKPKALRR